jgi:hypothetical protein
MTKELNRCLTVVRVAAARRKAGVKKQDREDQVSSVPSAFRHPELLAKSA